jgi:hypothetical protein
MKSDRRHELQTNELADWLGERLDMLRPHATAIALGAFIVVVLIFGGAWYFKTENTAAAKDWGDYFSAFNQREPSVALEKLAKERSGTSTAMWAMQAVGDMNLAQGSTMLFSDRAEAQKLLQKAEATYKLVEAGATDPTLKSRAQIGLGKVYESLCQPEKAGEYYEKVATALKDTAIGKTAAEDAQRMKDERQVALLAWFAAQQPKKPAPIPGPGGATPGLPSDLPERPDIGLPSGLGLGNLGEGVPAAPPPKLPEPAKAEPAAKDQEPKDQEPKAEAKAEGRTESKAEPKVEEKAESSKPGS